MFNGYNETPLISYNEFNQERLEKKQENVAKWSYGHESGLQPAQNNHPNNRHSEFWSAAKPNFLGVANVVKCNCTGCYPSSENQSYQGDTTRHRPWLPRTFAVPLNGSNESCKLPAYQWDNGLSNQSSCYSENNLAYVQENGGKYSYYRAYQNHRFPERNQPGVITSVKEAEFGKKGKNEMTSRGQESPVQNGARQPAYCSPGYNLTKKPNARNYCDPNDKHSNIASYSVDQHLVRLPVVEPFLKAVPSNLSQNRVPSTGYRSVKENMPQPFIDSGYGDPRKISAEPTLNGEKRSESFSMEQVQTGVQIDYSHFNRDFQEIESQKLFFDNTRHPDCYSRGNIQDVIKRNNQTFENRKDCAMNQMSTSEQHYNLSRSKYQDVANPKSSYEAFYPKDFEKTRMDNSGCFQRNEDAKNENMNVLARLPQSALLFNDPRFADKPQNSFPYQSNPVAYRNYLRPEYSCQSFSAQERFEYPGGFQRNEINEFRGARQQISSCEQFSFQQTTGLAYDPNRQINPDKMQQFYLGKNPSAIQSDSVAVQNKKSNYLEAIRSDEINKNGTSKISPLRLLRKKKFINVPQEPTPVSSIDAPPGLDVRKFWSTWADEEDENVAPTQMVVLDCQNIDPEQAKLLHLYETDPLRTVHLDTGNIILKGSCSVKEAVNQNVSVEEIKLCEPPIADESKIDVLTSEKDIAILQQEKVDECHSNIVPELGNKSAPVEPVRQIPSPPKGLKKGKSEQENRGRKKKEVMDKWTEKKFDFLKRAEESKAAEILRHEEEKKKIIETRLSLQQSLKKTEKPQEKNVPERLSPLDDNSQSDSIEDGITDTSNLPTSEYRRNKFLDYSEKNIDVDDGGNFEKFDKGIPEDEKAQMIREPTKVNDIKKEENIKLECLEKKLELQPTDKSFSPLNIKLKEEIGFEMDDILKKISEINFEGSEMKFENPLDDNSEKKLKTSCKKPKKKKSDQPENDERTDKLTVETVTKPTIKFSIQKSHDLKISFKVLNSSNGDTGNEDVQDKGSALEDSKNSTECFTLKYKSFQRDSDRRLPSGLKKSRKKFRKKKLIPEMKTPVLKIKKSRFISQKEKDPLANDDDDDDNDEDGDNRANTSGQTFEDEYSTSDGFQVQETVDSAKIKLTFKRHKGNFETECKINSNNVEKIEEEVKEVKQEEEIKPLEVAKTVCAKKSKDEINSGSENHQNFRERLSEMETDSPYPRNSDPVLEDDSRNSSTFRDSTEEENYDFESEPQIFSAFTSDTTFDIPTPENGCTSPIIEETGNRDVMDDSKPSEETEKLSQEQIKSDINHVINCDGANGSEDKRDKFSLFECSVLMDEKEVIQEISSDFIRSTKSQEIEMNHKSKDSLEIGNPNVESTRKINCDLENSTGIKYSLNEESFCEFKSQKEDEERKIIDVLDDGGFKETSMLGFKNENLTSVIPEKDPELETTKIIENCSVKSPLNDSVRNKNVNKNSSPLGISENLENPFEDLIRNDLEDERMTPTKKNSDSVTLEISPKERNHSEIEEDEPETKSLNSSPSGEGKPALNPDTTENLKVSPNLEPELESASEEIEMGAAFEETLKSVSITKLESSFSVPSETQPENQEEKRPNVDLLKFEPELKGNSDLKLHAIETVNYLESDDSSFSDSSLLTNETSQMNVKLDSKSQIEKIFQPQPDFELEDGEIIDSSDDSENRNSNLLSKNQTEIKFIARKIERRHSIKPERLSKKRDIQSQESWLRNKFSKAKSCPPDLKIPEDLKLEMETTMLDIPIEEIPLPLGPPPFKNCLNIKEYKRLRESQTESEAKEKPKESIFTGGGKVAKESDSPFEVNKHEKSQNSSSTHSNTLGIFQRNSKIKFSFSRRSRFSKLSLNNANEPKLANYPKTTSIESKVEKTEIEGSDFETNKDIQKADCETGLNQCSAPKECQIEEVPNANVAKENEGTKASKKITLPQNNLEAVELLCEDLEESVEVIDAMTDLIRDEFYECEDIPTSEDLTNGDDLEMEKVNDDKFRNIMQNCLDNAKKFLNEGNLKLFSCSVDDLLELDCQPSEPNFEENDTEKPTNHISRDVLLTSCGETNEDLDLTENTQPGDISMDFVSSFCSDVCPEILPVDNWPYLEEEVTSSPTQSKQDELIQSLEDAVSDVPTENSLFCPKDKSLERPGRKRVFSETSFRQNLTSDGETLRFCSKISSQRRKTVESFTTLSYRGDIRDIKDGLAWLKNGRDEAEKKSLKCRLSLEKLTNKQRMNFEVKNEKLKNFSKTSNGMNRKYSKSLDYKSPSWQPKVMLFRISKNELRKILRSSKAQSRLDSKVSEESSKREISQELETDRMPAFKKLKSESEIKKLEERIRRVNEKIEVGRMSDGSERGSLVIDGEGKKRKKSRFRNLHSKKKTEPEISTAPNDHLLVDPEILLTEIFKNCHRDTKDVMNSKDFGEREKKKQNESLTEKRIEKEMTVSHGNSKEDSKQEKREKSDRKHDHRDRKIEKNEVREDEIHKDKHREGESRKHGRHGSSHYRNRHEKSEPERRKSDSGGRVQKIGAKSPHSRWVCEVCGFNEADERIAHIKSHPFHCQSCHLAFKTESHFISHLTKKHKDIRNQHHCLLCELSFDTEEQYQNHLGTREHRHLESVEKNTINTLFTLLTGAPCPVLGLVEMKPEWLPNQAGTVHFYHQATPLSLALQYLKMHRDLSSFSTNSSTHPT